jgi:hypothetical protein
VTYAITLTDTSTSTTKTIEWESGGSWGWETEDEFVRYHWEEGNFGCDCNRDTYFDREMEHGHIIQLDKIVNLTTGKEVELICERNRK